MLFIYFSSLLFWFISFTFFLLLLGKKRWLHLSFWSINVAFYLISFLIYLEDAIFEYICRIIDLILQMIFSTFFICTNLYLLSFLPYIYLLHDLYLLRYGRCVQKIDEGLVIFWLELNYCPYFCPLILLNFYLFCYPLILLIDQDLKALSTLLPSKVDVFLQFRPDFEIVRP